MVIMLSNLGYGLLSSEVEEYKKDKLNKAQKGHLKKAGLSFCKYLREYRIQEPTNFFLGQNINAENFSSGQFVDISGNSIGKGFAGTIKRYNFSRRTDDTWFKKS